MATKEDLGAFLRSRRARLAPADVGLPVDGGVRRVPGLRREEIARLAGVSIDYYVRLEQGRDITASESVVEAVARALLLDEDERLHLFHLARPRGVRESRRLPPREPVRAGVRTLVESVQTPAFVVDRRLNLLALNRMTRALLSDFDSSPLRERNHARAVFLDPAARELYVDWGNVARDDVATLRMAAGRDPDDLELAALIGELTVKSAEFAAMWASHEVLRRSHGSKRYRHPIVGDLTLAYEALQLPDDPDLTLFVYTVEPGSPSERALRLLDSWSA